MSPCVHNQPTSRMVGFSILHVESPHCPLHLALCHCMLIIASSCSKQACIVFYFLSFAAMPMRRRCGRQTRKGRTGIQTLGLLIAQPMPTSEVNPFPFSSHAIHPVPLLAPRFLCTTATLVIADFIRMVSFVGTNKTIRHPYSAHEEGLLAPRLVY